MKRAGAMVTEASIPAPDQPGRVILLGRVLERDWLLGPSGGNAGAPVLAAYFELLDRRSPALSASCLALLLLGGVIFLIPSVEVLILALSRVGRIFFQ